MRKVAACNCTCRTLQLCRINKHWLSWLVSSCLCDKVAGCEMHSRVLQVCCATKWCDKIAGVTSALVIINLLMEVCCYGKLEIDEICFKWNLTSDICNVWYKICLLLLVGSTVFREPRNFEPSRGIWPLPRNFRVLRKFTEFHVNTEILWQRPSSVSLYCCCNCDTQSLRTATQACWFQWRLRDSFCSLLSSELPFLWRNVRN